MIIQTICFLPLPSFVKVSVLMEKISLALAFGFITEASITAIKYWKGYSSNGYDIIFSIQPANDAIKEKHCMKNIMKRKKY